MPRLQPEWETLMAFVKLDTGILNSTLWVARDERDIFITALLMALPHELTEPVEQINALSLEKTGFVVPPGWYGFVQAAGPGIVRMAMTDPVAGMQALQRLGEPDQESRSTDHEGRRLVRVDGGYIVLNFMRYRDKDSTAAVRAQRYRERKKVAASQGDGARVTRDASQKITIAEAEAEAEAAIQGAEQIFKSSRSKNIFPVETLDGPAKQTRRSAKSKGNPAPTTLVWSAYAEAYEERWGAAPVRNAQINGQLANLIARIGAEEAPHVAAFFLSHRNGLYVNAMHPVNLLLRDCEKLRTEWATKTQMTRTQANMADKTQTNMNAFAPLIARAEAEERAQHEQQG